MNVAELVAFLLAQDQTAKVLVCGLDGDGYCELEKARIVTVGAMKRPSCVCDFAAFDDPNYRTDIKEPFFDAVFIG